MNSAITLIDESAEKTKIRTAVFFLSRRLRLCSFHFVHVCYCYPWLFEIFIFAIAKPHLVIVNVRVNRMWHTQAHSSTYTRAHAPCTYRFVLIFWSQTVQIFAFVWEIMRKAPAPHSAAHDIRPLWHVHASKRASVHTTQKHGQRMVRRDNQRQLR